MSDLTILFPAYNEEDTICESISRCRNVLKTNNIIADILVVDNNSVDNTFKLAEEAGVNLVKEKEVGYGCALICGIKYAQTKYCIMMDADCSYDFDDIPLFYNKLKLGGDFIIGDRYKGGIEKSSMPLSHKYIGTPLISFMGRLIHKNKIHDYNCGMRAFDVEKIKKLGLKCKGMDFASEMVIAASKAGLKICEVPTKYHKDKRAHKGNLKTIPDGWRHIKTILTFNSNH